MANHLAIHSVGSSVVTYLRNSYPEALRTQFPCDFRLLSGADVAGEKPDMPTTLSLLLYRVVTNEALRNASRNGDPFERQVPLSLDLNYLLTVWAPTAMAEHTILGWALRQLYLQPVFDASLLSPEAAWAPGDSIHLLPLDLSTEDIMRLWDALAPGYRLSVAYVARVVRIDADRQPDALPVVARRLAFESLESGPSLVSQ